MSQQPNPYAPPSFDANFDPRFAGAGQEIPA
jgi:hypothetical protein